MQLIDDDQWRSPQPGEAAAAPPINLTIARSSRPPGAMTTVAIVAGLALVGGAIGGIFGSRTTELYQSSVSVQVDQVMVFQPWEVNLETARFATALLRTDLQDEAMESLGLDRGAITEIQADNTDSSPIVDVTVTVADRDMAEQAANALIDVTLRALVAGDQVPQQLIIDDITPQLDAANAEMSELWTLADVAPGTNLTDTYNQARYNLATATAEQEIQTEQWRLDQLPGIIAQATSEIDTIQPLLDRWYAASTTASALNDRYGPAQSRLRDLSLGLQVLDSGSHRSAAEVIAVPKTTSMRRWAAGGAAIGVAAALMLLAAIAARSARRLR
jgi:hypothetical protein